MNTMKKSIFKKILITTMTTLFVIGGLGVHKVNAMKYTQGDTLNEDEVLVKGEGGRSYILNKKYSIFTSIDFYKFVNERVAEQVKIWDVENTLKDDLTKIRQQTVKDYKSYHLMTNDERDDIVNAAKKKNLSLQQYLINCGIDLSDAPKHMTTAYGGPNRIWHYSDFRNMTKNIERDLYFEKFNTSTNHHDNTKVGIIDCSTEDRDRFKIPYRYSKYWKFISQEDDHYNEFSDVDYLLLYVKLV